MNLDQEGVIVLIVGFVGIVIGTFLAFWAGLDPIASLFFGVLLGNILARMLTWNDDFEVAIENVGVRIYLAVSDTLILAFGLYVLVIYQRSKCK